MDLSHLEKLFGEAMRLTGHREFVVVGSLSALGIVQDGRVPPRMLMSIDVDCYTRNDPARIFELREALGEGSVFEAANGYYLDPISPRLPTLPAQWEYRLIRVPLGEGLTVFFLDPNDAAVSKYARGEARDREWLQAGLAAGLLSAPVIASRMRETDFLDDEERGRALRAFAEDVGG
ncbi:MAG: hypothetical protein Q8O34_05210 [Rhodocyclaceae bacterium]|nr:hypothetical protein [Rhodocyclaceae bacterium]